MNLDLMLTLASRADHLNFVRAPDGPKALSVCDRIAVLKNMQGFRVCTRF